MLNAGTYKTKFGTFYDKLTDDDVKYFEMTDDEFDRRANRLAYKTANGIRDKEVIEADERVYRNKELFFGKEAALLWKEEGKRFFG